MAVTGMLSIGKLAASGAQLDYYERQVADGLEDYYSGRGEAPGRWIGSGASEIGLVSGEEVTADAFALLMRGISPVDESVLRRMGERSKVAALDLTFSAPKSVSVLYAVGGPELSDGLAAAHDAAVAAALGYLEREACWTRRGHAGAERVRGEGFVGAAYRHRLSRARDPQLHTHVVVANLTRALGRYTALDARALYEHKSAAGAVYRAVLRDEVRERFGWGSWLKVGRGLFEIEGVPAAVLRHFSQRRAEIEERAVELVGAGAGTSVSLSREAMQTIALATRRPLEATTDGAADWRADARARAAEHGLGPAEVAALVSRPVVETERPSWRPTVERLSGPEGLTGNHNTFARRHALAELAGEFPAGIGIANLELVTDGYLADASVEPLATDNDGQARYSTVGLLACEQRILHTAFGSRGAGVGVLGGRRVDAVLRDAGLNEDQEIAVRTLAESGNGVDTVQALAGTGKTTMLRVVANAYRDAGYEVAGVAPTARAARELRDAAGIPAGTIHALTGEADRRGGLARGVVLMIDEAGMAPTRITARLFEHAQRAGAKIIAVGDAGQLTSVEAGGWFAALAGDHGGAKLLQVMRQRDPAERAALAALHDGDPETYLAHKASDTTLHADGADALRAAVNRWADLRHTHGPDGAVMIVRDNATREALNALARQHLRAAGELSKREFAFGGQRLAVGDRVITRRNDRRIDVDNGGIATVTGVRGGQVHVRTADGRKRVLPAAYAAEHLEHAYAVTGHASQGATAEAAVVVGRPEDFTREWAYTAL
ncbi:MAG: relaxase domain-containing protein, partial [Conexibacteraceae bacterium]|nr:relaxase domain-containing protein [Conexibacteraceae bacterium]